MEFIKILPVIGDKQDASISSFYSDSGADWIAFCDQKAMAQGETTNYDKLKKVVRTADIPVFAFGHIKRFEDCKKMIYAGARAVCTKITSESETKAVIEAVDRFGSDKVYALWDSSMSFNEFVATAAACNVGGIILSLCNTTADTDECKAMIKTLAERQWQLAILTTEKEDLSTYAVKGIGAMIYYEEDPYNAMTLKQELREKGIPMNTLESSIPFDNFKLNSDGLIPVVTQDYKTNEVLMVAYMNKEAYETTIKTGLMTYYSRSRQELWTKGLTSGHLQYVKSLQIDCDSDTILAKVAQVGAACHTGNRTCFFTDLMKKDYNAVNPLTILQEDYDIIAKRKEEPKEGSYTNYLFDKGIDKILKKVGEEATEIVIASKNPDAEELRYEIADFLYHMMVLMVETGLTWEDITNELMERRG